MDHATIEKDQVIDRYVAGNLSAEESELFEEHYLDCAQCIEQVEAAEGLQRGLQRVVEEEATKALRRGFVVTFLAWSRSLSGGLMLTVLLATLLLPFFWQQRQLANLSGDLETTRRELAAAQNPGHDPKIEELRSELAAAKGPQVNARVYSLSPFRDGGQGPGPHHQIVLPPDGSQLVLALDAGGGDADRYQATLRRYNEIIWRSTDLEPDELGSVVVSFPSDFFETGDYALEIKEVVSTGATRPVARYPISISRLE